MKRASPLPLHLPHLGLAVVPHCCTSTAITMVGEELEEEEGEELEEERVDESCARVFFLSLPQQLTPVDAASTLSPCFIGRSRAPAPPAGHQFFSRVVADLTAF